MRGVLSWYLFPYARPCAFGFTRIVSAVFVVTTSSNGTCVIAEDSSAFPMILFFSFFLSLLRMVYKHFITRFVIHLFRYFFYHACIYLNVTKHQYHMCWHHFSYDSFDTYPFYHIGSRDVS